MIVLSYMYMSQKLKNHLHLKVVRNLEAVQIKIVHHLVVRRVAVMMDQVRKHQTQALVQVIKTVREETRGFIKPIFPSLFLRSFI